MSIKAYILRNPEVPWGDYGEILLSGISYISQENDLLELERTGPFVPPLSLPDIGGIVVTETLKDKLNASGLTGFTFRPVTKKRIVHLEWEKWDKEAPDPVVYPETGEPEDYILLRPHSPSLADNMESLWEMVLKQTALIERVRVGPYALDVNIHLVISSWNGDDFFRAEGVRYNYVSERAKLWLEHEIPEWVEFEESRLDSQLAESVRWTPSLSFHEELRELVRQGKLISAINKYQQEKGCSLADARAYIESL